MLRYSVTEKVLLEHIKGLDLDDIYGDKTQNYSVDTLKNLLQQTNNKSLELNEKIKSANDEEELFAIMEFKRKRNIEKEDLIAKINSIENVSEVVRLSYNYDIGEISNQDNTVLRRKTNENISKVVSSIKCLRTDSSYIGAYYSYDITYHKDILKHLLLTDSNGALLSEISIYQKNNERTYIVKEDKEMVFRVESNGDIWVLYASRKKSIDDLLYYINVMMVGREPDSFAYVLNEDMIEWID
ncbi:hypothetical protein NFK84_08285 [Enterobacter ludwigii]|uniref:hypothetical protein n=1 Tax=Enterobacter ludwigii TaxID=299767 RepID=UPI0024312F4E|nr:hypothetical protein [Enterobacter ludwigii]WGA06306.1 hypothetical protein NFK84_08285 [Enterobacter ludwigii]